MSIVAACPHCESRYNLSPDLVGKAMRCPNPDCREVFTVSEVVAAAPVPEPKPPAPVGASVPPVTGRLSEFVPILEVESAAPPLVPEVVREPVNPFRFEAEPAPVKVLPAPVPAKLLPPVAPARIVPPPTPAGPRELRWDEKLDAPAFPTVAVKKPEPTPPAPIKPSAAEDAELAAAIAARKLAQRRLNPRRVLYAILLGIAVFGIGAVVKVLWFNTQTEEKLARDAKEDYDKGNYDPAAEKYGQLLTRFPESEKKDQYAFLQSLSKVRAAVSAVTVADNPYPAVKAYRDFLDTYGPTPFAKPDAGQFAADVLETGKQAVDGLVACGYLRLKEFRDAGRQPVEPLDAADKAAAEATGLLPLVEGFREKETPPLEGQQTGIVKVSAEIAAERHRLAVLAPFRTLPEDPSDERIVTFEGVLRKEKLDADEEARVLVSKAKAALRDKVRPVRQGIPAVDAPADAAPSSVPVPAVDAPPPPPGSERKSTTDEVFFAQARGILFAFDADTGRPLWLTRFAAGTANPFLFDLPARAETADGNPDVVLVASDLGNAPGLTARDARTGEPRWHQPLEAPVAGRPVIVKRRAYAPLRDPHGTVVEFDLTDGTRLGQIRLHQPIGPGATLRPDTGLLYIAAEARRVFVLDVDARDADGNRQPARCVQIIPTEHAKDTLKVSPVVVGPAGTTPAPRFLVVLQTDGPAGMTLRAYPVADPPRTVDPAAPIPELPAAPPAVETTVGGWAAFPPETDGERCGLVTDRGVFALFGVNQRANADAAVFAVPVNFAAPPKADTVVPGQVVLADEDSTWVLAGGDLVRLRQAIDPKDGWKVIPAGPPRPLGEPLHRPQVNARRDLVMVTVRSPATGACRAVCFDPRDGRIAWQRQLGAIPPTAPLATAAGVLLPDEDGGVVLVDPKRPVAGTKPVAVDTALGPPIPHPAGPTALAATDAVAWVVVPERGEKDTLLLRIRSITNGALASSATVPLPDHPAGRPLALGEFLYLPLADGIVYRFKAGMDKLAAGQTWKADGAPAGARCFLAAGAGDTIFTSDGADRFRAWTWPAASDARMSPATAAWEAIGPVALPPLLVKKWLLVADPGGLAAYAPDRTGEPARKWRSGKDLPAGKPTHGPVPVPGTDKVLYVLADKHVVAITPNADTPAWTWTSDLPDDLIGLTTDGTKVYATTAAGQIRVLSADAGKPVGDPVAAGIPGALPTLHGAAIPFGPNRVLVPMLDGSAVVVFVPQQ